MKLSIEKVISLGFALALLILAFIGIVSYRTTAEFISVVEIRQHSQVLEKLEEIFSLRMTREGSVVTFITFF